eukprot:COSAG03_NODE_6441_length_1059_cov_27.406250_1_plen_53_part_10
MPAGRSATRRSLWRYEALALAHHLLSERETKRAREREAFCELTCSCGCLVWDV